MSSIDKAVTAGALAWRPGRLRDHELQLHVEGARRRPAELQGQEGRGAIVSKEEGVRYGAEDALAREITARGAVGIAAYSLIPKELTQDKEKAKEFLAKAGVAGVVVMRAVGKEQEISSARRVLGRAYYATFWGGGYYGYGWGGVYSPGYVRTDTIMHVEILVYSLEQDKLVWAARSETTNPAKVGPFIKELTAKAAGRDEEAGPDPGRARGVRGRARAPRRADPRGLPVSALQPELVQALLDTPELVAVRGGDRLQVLVRVEDPPGEARPPASSCSPAAGPRCAADRAPCFALSRSGGRPPRRRRPAPP